MFTLTTRKTRDEWHVEGFYSRASGWEMVTSEDSRRAAVVSRKEYDANEPEYPHRIRLRRVRITEEN